MMQIVLVILVSSIQYIKQMLTSSVLLYYIKRLLAERETDISGIFASNLDTLILNLAAYAQVSYSR